MRGQLAQLMEEAENNGLRSARIIIVMFLHCIICNVVDLCFLHSVLIPENMTGEEAYPISLIIIKRPVWICIMRTAFLTYLGHFGCFSDI